MHFYFRVDYKIRDYDESGYEYGYDGPFDYIASNSILGFVILPCFISALLLPMHAYYAFRLARFLQAKQKMSGHDANCAPPPTNAAAPQ